LGGGEARDSTRKTDRPNLAISMHVGRIVRRRGSLIADAAAEGLYRRGDRVSVSIPRMVGGAFECDELGARQRRREAPCLSVRDDAIALSMDHERGRAHAIDERPRVERERQLEQSCRDLRIGALALTILEPALALTVARIEELGERAGTEPPVRANERGESPLRLRRQERFSGEIAREKHELLDAVRMPCRIGERNGPAARATEE